MNTPLIQFTGNETVDLIILIVIIVWSLAWKGIALWTAAKENSKPWFIVLLIIGTVGILEILYIFIFSKKILSKNYSDQDQNKDQNSNQDQNPILQ